MNSNLKSLSNSQLFDLAKKEVQEETNATLRVLYVLREIERRRAFAEKSYPSLFEFCTEFLGYKKGAAYRRIMALRTLKEVPEVEEKIRAGGLSLTTLSQLQTHFVRKKKENRPLAKEEKLKLIESFENKSTREADKMILALTPKEIPVERLKAIDDETFELKLALPKRVYEKLQKLKAHMGPEKASVETLEAFEKALDIANREYEKKFDKRPAQDQKRKDNIPTTGLKNKKPELSLRKYIPIATQRAVWKRDQGKCTFPGCGSRYRPELDHIIPVACGGTNEISNLRLACRAHNQLHAINTFGLNKMESYLSG
jgi:5-methylcytosine-specific restriction enzyme A